MLEVLNTGATPVMMAVPTTGVNTSLPKLPKPACLFSRHDRGPEWTYLYFDISGVEGIDGEPPPIEGFFTENIRIYYTLDASVPTINTGDNKKVRLGLGGIFLNKDEVTNGIAFAAFHPRYQRSESTFIPKSKLFPE
jgi:hypothetical protein